jgi:hypothetical protein
MGHLTEDEKKQIIMHKAMSDASQGKYEKPNEGLSGEAQFLMFAFSGGLLNLAVGNGLSDDEKKENEIYEEVHRLAAK